MYFVTVSEMFGTGGEMIAKEVDRVRLYGLASASEEKELIEGLVKGIKGVKTVVNDLTVLKGPMTGV